ncbi:hypothetical protein ACFV3R_19280 [Streptomyces sp. NPDC059740]|uniref:hypothetical protein n=1 Tax=Streptomyces sp. NPDC059740 TaxID=3346926 RepID=UPI003655D7F1
MSIPNCPQPAPGWAPPPPQKKKTGKIVGFGCGGLVLLLVLIVVVIATTGGGDAKGDKKAEASPSSAAPSATGAGDRPRTDAKPTGKPAEKPAPQKTYGDGDYQVGKDIPEGTYESAGAAESVLELCTITTEPKGDLTMPQLKTAQKGERVIITLAEKDGVVTVQGCKPLTLRK